MDNTYRRAFALHSLRLQTRSYGKGAHELISPSRVEPLIEEINSWEKEGIKVLSLGEADYPELLSTVQNPPPLIFFKGVIPKKPMLAIVGTRKADKQALAWTEKTSEEISASENCVVSGLAIGIDGAAHRGALKSKLQGNTVAVLAGGLRNIYPRVHDSLALNILDSGGALISIHEPSEPPLPRYFLERNQIIAGLSLGVLVVQAAERSGSIATANAALDHGRELLALPGSVFNHLSVGTNRLIKSGAHMVLSVEDIFEALPGLLKRKFNSDDPSEDLSVDEKALLSLLSQHDKIHLDDLIEKLSLPAPSVASLVSDLETQRVVVTDHQDFVFLIKAKS